LSGSRFRCINKRQEAQLPLTEQGVSFVHSSHHNATLLFEFIYTLRVGLLAKIHDSGRTRVYKNSTHSSLTCTFLRTPSYIRIKREAYRHKLESTLNNFVISFPDNVGLILCATARSA